MQDIEETTELSDQELKAVQQYADQRGLTLNQAATELAKQALAKRVRKSTGKTPARNVLKMPRG